MNPGDFVLAPGLVRDLGAHLQLKIWIGAGVAGQKNPGTPLRHHGDVGAVEIQPPSNSATVTV